MSADDHNPFALLPFVPSLETRKRDQAKLDTESRSGFNDPDAPLGVVDTQKADDFDVGPLSILKRAVEKEKQVLISVRNNKKLHARVKAFDRHCNMVRSSPPFLRHHITHLETIDKQTH